MFYVYILKSEADESRFYIGSTSDLKKRLAEHNLGKSIHTNKFRPWHVKTYLAFSDKKKAAEFEDYLKSSSGRAFAKKRL